MGIFDNILKKVSSDFSKYVGDTAFLDAACSAAALVVNADGAVDDAEITSALKGLVSNQNLSGIYTPAVIEQKLTEALNDSKTRAGKMKLTRTLEAVAARPVDQRQDIVLIAADVADQGGIDEIEKTVLIDLGKILNLDAGKLLGL